MKNRNAEAAYRFILPQGKQPAHSPRTETAILESLRAVGCDVRKQKTINIVDIYLDTFDWKLFKKDISLRFRKLGNKGFYFLNNLNHEEKSASGNVESEETNQINEPWNVADEKIKREITGIISPRRLMEQIALRIRRNPSRIISPEGIQIEVFFDSIILQTVNAGAPATGRLTEFSLRLKTGAVDVFKKYAEDIAEKFSLAPASPQTLKDAIALLNITFPAKNPPPAWVVRRDDRFDTAVKKILAFQFHRLQENIPGAVDDIDTEFVHQARVSTRKMRSLLRLSDKAIPRGSAIYFTEELLWLGSLFGSVRDLDVFSLNLPVFENAIGIAPKKAMDILHGQIHVERMRNLAALKDGLASPRQRIFSLRLSAFIARQPALHPVSPLALKTVEEIVPPMITDLYRELTVRGNRILLNPKIENFHKLRIQFKKIRYACEFFNQAFDGKLAGFIEDVVKIQDCLGELQDTVFTKELITGFLSRWKGSVVDRKLLFMLGEIYQLQMETARARQSEFYEIWKQFDREETISGLNEALGIGKTASTGEKTLK